MTEAYGKKYQAAMFDPDDPNDAMADRARCAILSAWGEAMSEADDTADRQVEFLLAGLLVGVVQVMQATLAGSPDEADAAIRASIIQTAGWATDAARAMQGKDPLSESN